MEIRRHCERKTDSRSLFCNGIGGRIPPNIASAAHTISSSVRNVVRLLRGQKPGFEKCQKGDTNTRDAVIKCSPDVGPWYRIVMFSSTERYPKTVERSELLSGFQVCDVPGRAICKPRLLL